MNEETGAFDIQVDPTSKKLADFKKQMRSMGNCVIVEQDNGNFDIVKTDETISFKYNTANTKILSDTEIEVLDVETANTVSETNNNIKTETETNNISPENNLTIDEVVDTYTKLVEKLPPVEPGKIRCYR